MSEHRVKVDNGKYTFVAAHDGSGVSILRHDKPWHGPQNAASNALIAIMCELDAARVVVAQARQTLLYATEGLAPSQGLRQAIDRHDRLVGDDEPPSEWTE